MWSRICTSRTGERVEENVVKETRSAKRIVPYL
jgi:hypothetical protein